MSLTVSPPNLVMPGQRPPGSHYCSKSILSIMSSSTAAPPGLIPPISCKASTVCPGSLPSIGSISPMSNLPPLQHPGLQVPSTAACSHSVSSEGSLSASVLTMRHLGLSRSPTESMSSPSVSSMSLTTMPSIIVPHTAPPSPSLPELHSLMSVCSLSKSQPVTPSAHMPSLWSIHITLAESIHIALASLIMHHSLICSMMSTESNVSNVSYRSTDLEPSPPFIPVNLPEHELEYEPTYSGLKDTLSIMSSTTASCGYDVVHQYPPTPSFPTAESMETAEINEMLELLLKSVPKSPSLPTTCASSISLSTPEGNEPSIHPLTSKAEMIYSDGDLNDGVVPPSHIISHDVDTIHEGESRDMADHLCHIEEELFDLLAFLHQRRPTPPPAPQPIPVPAPVPAPAEHEPQVIHVLALSKPTQVI
ncbi:hypothetical protein FRC11_009569 [Ceratobasidium sp. 423]|nr:hypothetical protein FRC11_009569 [Ceratobasidium sp. 423]